MIVCFSNEMLVSNLPNTFDLQGYEIFLLITSLFISELSYLLVSLTALEVILAQAPRSMQGLLIGVWYAYQSLEVPVMQTSLSSSITICTLSLLALYCQGNFGYNLSSPFSSCVSLVQILLERRNPLIVTVKLLLTSIYTERQILNASARISVDMTDFYAEMPICM